MLAVLASGCNYVYGLDPTELRDQSDVDGDGVYDAADNCVDTPNAPLPGQTDQLDNDHDTVGDACDNCPLLSNVEQRDVGDSDGIGDLCDPHPTTNNDCLVVLDTFGDPARLLEHWQVISLVGDVTGVVPEVGRVRLRPRTSDSLAIAAKGPDGMLLADDFDLLVRGKLAPAANGSIFHVVTDAAVPSFGYGCGLRFVDGPNVEATVAAMGGISTTNTMPLAPPVDDDFVIRLASRSVESPFAKVCRVEYGVSVGIQSFGGQQPKGWTGVRTVGAAVEITGIALTKHVASGTCPPAQRW